MTEKQQKIKIELENKSKSSIFFKSPDKVGKIYSKNLNMDFKPSVESLDVGPKQNCEYPLLEVCIDQRPDSPLINNKKSNLQLSRMGKSIFSDSNSTLLQINPVTSKSFRINKMQSSGISSNHYARKKNPQLIGKLSSSKLNLEQTPNYQESAVTKSQVARSPGHFVHTKYAKYVKKVTRQHNSVDNNSQTSKLMQFIGDNLKTSQQIEKMQTNPQKNLFNPQMYQKSKYVKSQIQKRHKAEFQVPLAQKNIQQLKHSYPVSKNRSKSLLNKRAISYLQKILQKIDQSSKLFKDNLVSPKFLNKIKEVTTGSIVNQINKRINDDQNQVLTKSRTVEMRISPQVKVSFTVKSPKKSLKSQIINPSQQNHKDQSKQNLTRVSFYSPEQNLHFNNRKPKYISLLIDPSTIQIQKPAEFQIKDSPDLSIVSNFFSRFRNDHSSETSPQQISQQIFFVTLKTPISTIKQILIESDQRLNLSLSLPPAIFQNKKMSPQTQIKDLHLFMQRVYIEMRKRPQIVTIKRYKNAIFTGMMLSSTKDFQTFSSIIYHFNGDLYVGGWKESRNPFNMHKQKVQGFKQGKGLHIAYQTVKNDKEDEANDLIVNCYYGQFKENLKSGYGIEFKISVKQNKVIEEKIVIGCWIENQKHGWAKIYKNNNLQINGEFEKGKLVKQRNPKPQDRIKI